MGFQGTILTPSALLQLALQDQSVATESDGRVHHTAAMNALQAVAAGEGLDAGWRFGVLQTLDDYQSTLRRGGPKLAARVFDTEPAPTGSPQLDAAFAALADFLSERDGWAAPKWTLDSTRVTDPVWYPAVPSIFRAEAEVESPRAFRERGIFITE
ncbi:hypothetical protein ATY41_06940 [Leifsonia xyli subsp. xyli]|uniref:Uncharacterized protein n=1 Tax=Leifsonia xyli subsp. xyli TaxID=59736 RepID=A0A1E2SMV6_LEIXY|nr:hypothetical protein [Leifsonia xyli]ODA91117.1 hypothetical protein ATY41_06940 [Leifsonia xyli subsp. xyli]